MKADQTMGQYTVEQLRDARALLCYLYSQVGDQSAQLMDCAIDAIDAFLAQKEVE